MSKYVTPAQMLKIVKTHLFTAAVIFLLGILIFASAVTSDIGSVLFSAIATIIYFFSIYSSAYDVAQRDKKSYTEEQPYRFKGLLLPIGLLIATVLLYALYLITWKFMTIDGSLYSVQGYINNILFYMWTFPFTAFINLEHGFMAWYGYVIVILLPFISSFLGYLAGYYNYDINGTLFKLIYNTNDKEKK